jgi:hypothetical protein
VSRAGERGKLRVVAPDFVDPVVEAYKPGIDRSLLARNLRLTPEERFRQLMQLQRFAEELRRAGTAARRGRR